MHSLLDVNQDIEAINIEDSIKTSYLDYSMSVIIGRALPDARDGRCIRQKEITQNHSERTKHYRTLVHQRP